MQRTCPYLGSAGCWGEFPAVEQWRNICSLAFHRRLQDTLGDITPGEELSKRFTQKETSDLGQICCCGRMAEGTGRAAESLSLSHRLQTRPPARAQQLLGLLPNIPPTGFVSPGCSCAAPALPPADSYTTRRCSLRLLQLPPRSRAI